MHLLLGFAIFFALSLSLSAKHSFYFVSCATGAEEAVVASIFGFNRGHFGAALFYSGPRLSAHTCHWLFVRVDVLG